MKPFHWQKLALATLAILFMHGAFSPAEARKGYLSRLQKRSSAPRVQSAEEVVAKPMGQIVLPLKGLSVQEVRQLLESTYGTESGIKVTQPGGSANGVIVTAPRDELEGIVALVKQAEPSDLDFLISVYSQLPEGIVSKEQLEDGLTPEKYASMRENAEKHLNKNKPGWKQRANTTGWFRSNRNALSRTAVRLQNVKAADVANNLQQLFAESDVRIEQVKGEKGAEIVLVTGPASALTSLRESIVQMDFVSGQETADEIADRTKYIRRMADSRNTAFRITQPYKPRIKPLPAITITGDPQPIFENTTANESRYIGEYVPVKVDESKNKKKDPSEFDNYFKAYIEESLKKVSEPRQPVIRVESGLGIDLEFFDRQDNYRRTSSGSSATAKIGRDSVSTRDDK